MRVVVAAFGSRGDVAPFLLLADRLAARGHAVVAALDRGHLTRVPAEVQPAELGELDASMLAAIVAEALASPAPKQRVRIAHARLFADRIDSLRARLASIVAGADVLICDEDLASLGAFTGPTAIVATTLPIRPVARAPSVLRLAALSPALFPEPELRATWTLTGFWLATSAGELTAEVEEFLNAGPPPFLLTMGSMRGFDAHALGATFAAAARRCRRRVIIQRGWAGIDAPPDASVLVVDGDLDYRVVFPRCAAIAMHGGTGTVAHALVAGRPVIVLPSVTDQFLWAHGLARLNVCVGAIDPREPSIEALLAAMRRATDDPRPETAANALSRALHSDGGVATACDVLEDFMR